MTYTAELIREESTQQGIARRIRYEKLCDEWAKERETEIEAALETIGLFKNSLNYL